MPLHLLGKKSWNVYNSTNIDRVRRDEAEARAREQAEEQRMQEEDAQRRIALLRGEDAPVATHAGQDHSRTVDDHYGQHERKRRRLRGEDDTDRDIRYARQFSEVGFKARQTLLRDANIDVALQDQAGNIQLFPSPDEAVRRKADRNPEAEAEKAQKRRRDEGQQNMRFNDAAGFSTNMRKPWYNSRDSSSTAENRTAVVLANVESKDVWGNEDPRRIERERNRLLFNDPLAAMKQAQHQLKQSERDRAAWEMQTAKPSKVHPKPRIYHSRSERERRHEDRDGLDRLDLEPPADVQCTRHGSHHRQRKEGRGHHRERTRERRTRTHTPKEYKSMMEETH